MNDSENFMQSPCIDQCCLDDGGICLGCFRSLDEITRWNSSSNAERMDILRNISKRQNDRGGR